MTYPLFAALNPRHTTMHNVTIAKIEARCEAFNTSHKLLRESMPALKAWVATMIGQTIHKVDGTLLAKFAKTKPVIPGVRIFDDRYSIRAVAEKTVTRKYTTQRGLEDYVNERGGFSRYLADVRDGVVSWNMHVDVDLHEGYSPDEVIKAIEKCEALELEMKKVTEGLHGLVSVNVNIQHP